MTYQLNTKTLYDRHIIHGIYTTYNEAYFTGAMLLQIKRIKAFSVLPIPAAGERLTSIKTNLIK